MKRLRYVVFALAFIFGVASIALIGGRALAGGDDGISPAAGIGEVAPTAVTLSVPSCVNKGEVVTISATYPQVTQLRGTAILRQPLIGPP